MREPVTVSPEVTRLIAEGNALEDIGRLPEALARYDAAIRIAPGLPRAHLNRGNALLASGDPQAAASAYLDALGIDSCYAPAWFNLGNAYAAMKRSEEAREAYRRALSLQPDFADAEVALGVVHANMGQHEAAVANFRRVLCTHPENVLAYVNLGNVLLQMGHVDEAIANYRNAIERDRRLADAVPIQGNLANALMSTGRYDEAIASYRRVLELAPTLAKAHFDLGQALERVGRFSEAISAFRAAIAYDPRHVEAHCMLGNLLAEAGQFDEAFASCRRALEIDPNSSTVHSHIGYAQRRLGQMNEAVASFRRAFECDDGSALALRNLLFMENSLGEKDPEELLAGARRYGELLASTAVRFTEWPNPPLADRRLKVGLVSGDFRDHAVGRFLENVLHALVSRNDCSLELHAYSNCTWFDGVSERIKASCNGWVAAAHMSDEALARRVRDDRIDILIDLAGYTAFNRLPAFAWKPAPVQVTWLGYLATTGLPEIDYLIADAWTLPESEERHFTEKVWRLPETYVCFTPPRESIEINSLPGLAGDGVTFGSFNNLSKLNDGVVAVWSRILKAVPTSRMLLKSKQFSPQGDSVGQVADRFSRHGIAADRLLFEGLAPRAEFLKPFHRVDIALDPFPYPGITTTVETLWMGVPVVTMGGDSFLSRQGVGLLSNAGLEDWIAGSADDYVAIATRHANDLDRLSRIRGSLRENLLHSPILDSHRFATNFEQALRGMWRQWCSTR